MSNEQNRISRRQIIAVAFVSILSPIFRNCPRELANISGHAAWLAPVAAVIPLLILILFTHRLVRSAGPGHGLAQMILDTLGPWLGRSVLMLIALWLLVYTGYLLRNDADRFILSIYPHSRPTVFVVVMLLLSLLAACGSLSKTARTAMVFRPILLVLFIILILFTLQDIHVEELLPVSRLEIVPAARGALIIVNTVGFLIYLTFLEDDISEPFTISSYLKWMLALMFTTLIIVAATIGVLGTELTAKASLPFFTMIRGITLFSTLERIEALGIALWVFTDFILISMLLFIITKLIRVCLNFITERWRTFLVLFEGAIILIISFFMPESVFHMEQLSNSIVPQINAAFLFVLFPLIFLIGLIRKTI